MKHFLPDYNVTKLLLDSAHDAMPYYEYCKRQNITPFIDLNGKGGVKLPYKNDFIIGKDGVPVCKEGTSSERSNKREKIDFKLENGRHRSTKMWYCRLYNRFHKT